MPFDFLDLPQEIQDLIYTEYIKCHSITLKNRLPTNKDPEIYFEGLPSLAIERVCQKFNQEVKQLRSQLWPQTLHYHANEVSVSARRTVGKSDKYTWLRDHIRHISIQGSRSDGHEQSYKFHNLRFFTTYAGTLWLPTSSPPYSSLQELQKEVVDWARIWTNRVHYAQQQVCTLSGDREEGVFAVIVQHAYVESLDCDVEVRISFNCIKHTFTSRKARYVSVTYIVEGKQIGEETQLLLPPQYPPNEGAR